MANQPKPNTNTQQVQEMPVFIDRDTKDLVRVIDALNQAHSKISNLQGRIAIIENKING